MPTFSIDKQHFKLKARQTSLVIIWVSELLNILEKDGFELLFNIKKSYIKLLGRVSKQHILSELFGRTLLTPARETFNYQHGTSKISKKEIRKLNEGKCWVKKKRGRKKVESFEASLRKPGEFSVIPFKPDDPDRKMTAGSKVPSVSEALH